MKNVFYRSNTFFDWFSEQQPLVWRVENVDKTVDKLMKTGSSSSIAGVLGPSVSECGKDQFSDSSVVPKFPQVNTLPGAEV